MPNEDVGYDYMFPLGSQFNDSSESDDEIASQKNTDYGPVVEEIWFDSDSSEEDIKYTANPWVCACGNRQ